MLIPKQFLFISLLIYYISFLSWTVFVVANLSFDYLSKSNPHDTWPSVADENVAGGRRLPQTRTCCNNYLNKLSESCTAETPAKRTIDVIITKQPGRH